MAAVLQLDTLSSAKSHWGIYKLFYMGCFHSSESLQIQAKPLAGVTENAVKQRELHLAVNQKKINNAPKLNLTDNKLFQKRREQVSPEAYTQPTETVCVH